MGFCPSLVVVGLVDWVEELNSISSASKHLNS